MNEAVMFDTHEAFKNFQKAGVAKEHAEVFVEELSKVVVSRSDELATKADVENLRVASKGDLKAGLAELEVRLMGRIGTMLAIGVGVILAAIGGAVGILLKMLGG